MRQSENHYSVLVLNFVSVLFSMGWVVGFEPTATGTTMLTLWAPTGMPLRVYGVAHRWEATAMAFAVGTTTEPLQWKR